MPGIHGLVHHGANAGERVALDLCLAATDPDVRLKWSASASSTGASGAATGVRPALAAGECGVWLVDGWTVGHDAESAGIGLLALGFERTSATSGETRSEFALANWAEHVTTALRRAQAVLEQGDAPLADVAHALALLPGEEHGLLDVAAHLPLPGALSTLRALDRHAQALRADAGTLAQLAALRGGDAAASANVRGLLARFLCARLQCGDATAAGEADFAARLAEAQAILQPGPWWWYRVARITKGAVRQLALERLADLTPPTALLRVLATEPAASLPAALQHRVAAWQAQETQDQRTGQAAMIGLHGMTLIVAVVALVAVVRARRGGRAVAALGLCAMATLVVDVRFGPWHLPPAAVGAGAVLLTIALWWRLQGGRAVWLAAVLAVAAFGAALLADTGQDAIAAGCASILALAALAGLAMGLGAHQRRSLRCLAWSTAAVLLVATATTAYVGLRALYLGVASDSLDAVILASPVAGWVRPAAIAGVLGLAAVLAAVMVVGAETRDRSRRGARPA